MLSKYDNGTTALRGVSVQIEPGEFAYIVGPSGAGKSTFIRLLYREVKHDKGSLKVADFDLDKIKNAIFLCCDAMWEWSSKIINCFQRKPFMKILLTQCKLSVSAVAILKACDGSFGSCRIETQGPLFPEWIVRWGATTDCDCSRAIVNNPKVLIADEPTGNLDPDNSWEIMNLLERINLQGTTVLMATHNSQIVNTLRHRVIAIENGRVVRDEAEGEYGYDD